MLKMALAVVAGCVALAGCAGPDSAGPDRAVTGFARSVSDSDGAAACAQLSPAAAAAVAEEGEAPCTEAILEADLPEPSPVRSSQVNGRSAFVTTGTDTVFLSEFDSGWKIIGVGCSPQGDAPYDCVVSGG